MDFALLPPEINSGRMYTGPGAGPMLAAAAAWDALARELESAAVGYSSVISGLAGREWSGPASVAMAVSAQRYVAWLQASSAQAEHTAIQAKTAAAAFAAAFAATVPPPVIAANRALLAALAATNFFGQNTPAIMATEAHYLEMWAQDAAAMYGYASASSSASALTPFSAPPQSTRQAGLGAQLASVGPAAGTATGAHTHALAQLTAAAPAAMHQLGSSSTPAAQTPLSLGQLATLSGPVSQVTGNASSAFNGLVDAYDYGTILAAFEREVLVRGGLAGFFTFQGLGPHGALSGVGGSLGGLGKAASLGPLAGLGQASSVGALSVPPSWAAAAPEVAPVALSLTSAGAGAVPVAAVGLPPGMALQEAMMGTTFGRGALSTTTERPDDDDKDKKKDNKEKDEKPGERSAAALIMPSGWLASTWAFHTRRRADPDLQPLPSQWEETLSANRSAWG
ncbi:PPE family protein [Mycobacterium sp.]|uniref:PPE family protein n=1 Tax=Mycobacterium sp. TaxID=1785 RepID=UPI0031E3BD0D